MIDFFGAVAYLLMRDLISRPFVGFRSCEVAFDLSPLMLIDLSWGCAETLLSIIARMHSSRS